MRDIRKLLYLIVSIVIIFTVFQSFKTDNDINKPVVSIDTPTITNIPSKKVLGLNTTIPLPAISLILPSPTIGQIISPQINKPTAGSSSYSTVAPTAAPSEMPTLTPTAAPIVVARTVSVEIKTADSSSNFSVELKDGMNVCDVLQKAKDEGKISSLTIDDSYLSNLKSRYVSEINGYKNNWTFKVNGVSPLGCSLSNPKPDDIIIWNIL